jgi:hypothetical protein
MPRGKKPLETVGSAVSLFQGVKKTACLVKTIDNSVAYHYSRGS